MTDSDDLVTVTGAAERLQVNKSTVSRQLRRFGILPDARGLFSFAAFAAARAAALNPLKARQNTGPAQALATGDLLGSAGAPADASADMAPPPAPTDSVTLMRAQAAEKAASARIKQLELAKRLGEVVDRAGVAAAAEDAGATLRLLLQQRNRDLAERVTPLTDVDAIELLLDDADRKLLAELQAKLQALMEAHDAAAA